eukprot:CAMPEP_0119365996 /NCGR_PEP_ID=MMETSP1334-20130426/12885_1 /TAXON_ID=127549 /ORGANISM="Calcidiscus leptoporus, Strain RCC1130" /LENGTH=139 /DNA_ID=CAMNT_0007382101 /DNA_START=8 /DNA_END=424 /DNA_ORIENTATION=-
MACSDAAVKLKQQVFQFVRTLDANSDELISKLREYLGKESRAPSAMEEGVFKAALTNLLDEKKPLATYLDRQLLKLFGPNFDLDDPSKIGKATQWLQNLGSIGGDKDRGEVLGKIDEACREEPFAAAFARSANEKRWEE